MLGRSVSVVVGVVLAIVATSGVEARGHGEDRGGRSPLVEEIGAHRIERHADTGRVRFIRGTTRRPAVAAAVIGGRAVPEVAAQRFMSRYGPLFGIDDAARQLRLDTSVADPIGQTSVRLQQVHRGVPVIAGDLVVRVDRDGDIISANGEASVTAAIDTVASIPRRVATRHAADLVARETGRLRRDLDIGDASLWVYDPALLGGRGTPMARLVWRVDVSVSDVRKLVLVDAQTGAIVLHFDQNAGARNRLICNAGNTASKVPCTSPYARVEGQGATGVADVDNAYVFSGHTYDFFKNRFGRDSLDGNGMAMRSTVRYCDPAYPCPYQNAFWNGEQMVYGAGYASADDVVGHELGHGVTDFTSQLYYYMQSGAINEALSDIFGELIDLTNGAGTDTAGSRWLMGEDLPGGAIRDMEHPPAYGQPDRMRSSHYTDDPSWVDQGGVHTNSGVANKAAFLMVDGGSFNGQSVSAIGIDKAAAIWYRVAAHALTSGSDYQDLYSALKQACTDLIGTTPKQGNGSASAAGAITSTHCAQVDKAARATEMHLQPNVAAAPEAALCTTGTPANVVFDRIDDGAPGWTGSGGDGATYGWFFGDWYATSGRYHLYGFGASDTDASITRDAATTIPANAFLHFRHAFDLEYGFDGGRLEYQVGSGAWTNAGPLFAVNGYNATVGAPFNGAAFTGFSYGYVSSRLDLSSLAGQSVRFRFRVASDGFISYEGWYVDDFRIYTCATGGGDTTPPTVTAPVIDFRKAGVTPKGAVPLKVSFTATDTSGIAATDLQQAVRGGSFTDVAMPSPTATSVNLAFKAKATTTRQFRARATDGASPGNTSTFATAPAVTIRPDQNGSHSIVLGGTWKTQSSASFYGGSTAFASAAGAKQSLTAVATDFAIVSTKGRNRGKATVYVDGVAKKTIDLYRSTTQYRRVIYAISFPTPASHTIDLRATGTKNPSSRGKRVDFDAFITVVQ